MNSNATELYWAMDTAINSESWFRSVNDAASPQRNQTLEAAPGRTFTLSRIIHNVVGCRPVDARWAVANTLHFFAATESAGSLRMYNRHADKFLTGDRWVGAYGKIAFDQLQRCVAQLTRDPQSRRAIVSMGGLGATTDVNQPACWSFLQFINARGGLHLCVYQRSLNLTNVMAYDCVVLTNILNYIAWRLELPPARLHWTVGSLHKLEGQYLSNGDRNISLLLPPDLLDKPGLCQHVLEGGECGYQGVKEILDGKPSVSA